MAFDREAAKAAGYSDEEIEKFLAENPEVTAPATEAPEPVAAAGEPPAPAPVYEAPSDRGVFPEFVRPHLNPSAETLGTVAAGTAAAATPVATYKGIKAAAPVLRDMVRGPVAPRPVAPPPAPAPRPAPSTILDASGRPMQRAAAAAEPEAIRAANAIVRNEALQRVLKYGGEALGTVGKFAGKHAPGVGAAFGAYDAANRLQQGDKFGAGIAGLSSAASFVPVVGTGVAMGLDAINLGRDYYNYRNDPRRRTGAR